MISFACSCGEGEEKPEEHGDVIAGLISINSRRTLKTEKALTIGERTILYPSSKKGPKDNHSKPQFGLLESGFETHF